MRKGSECGKEDYERIEKCSREHLDWLDPSDLEFEERNAGNSLGYDIVREELLSTEVCICPSQQHSGCGSIGIAADLGIEDHDAYAEWKGQELILSRLLTVIVQLNEMSHPTCEPRINVNCHCPSADLEPHLLDMETTGSSG